MTVRWGKDRCNQREKKRKRIEGFDLCKEEGCESSESFGEVGGLAVLAKPKQSCCVSFSY